MWLKTRRPPCHSPSPVWYCGERATRHAGSHVAETAVVPTIQPTTASFTTHAGSTVAVQAGPAAAAGDGPAAPIAAASRTIVARRRIRHLRLVRWVELPAEDPPSPASRRARRARSP